MFHSPFFLSHARSVVFATLIALSTTVSADATKSPPYTDLDGTYQQLRTDFNNAKGKVRLVFLVGPACPTCLRGLEDLDRDVLSKISNECADTFIVHLPPSGSTPKHIEPTFKLIHNSQVRHYWNGGGEIGNDFARMLDLRKGKELLFAWDVWMAYAPDAQWQQDPPKPSVMMHQLSKLKGDTKFAFLDSKEFRKQLKQYPACAN